jgi:hypothetical protein
MGIYWIKHKIIYWYITSHFSHFLSTAGLESAGSFENSPGSFEMDLGQHTQPMSMHHGPGHPGPGSYPWTIPGAYYDDPQAPV